MRISKEKNTAQNRYFKCGIFHHYIANVSEVTRVKLMDWCLGGCDFYQMFLVQQMNEETCFKLILSEFKI